MVLKVAFTHPEEQRYWALKHDILKINCKKPEDSNPVPGVEMPSLFYSHSVHNWQVFIAVVWSWDSKFNRSWSKVGTCVHKLDNGLELWKQEGGGRCCAEHRSTELGGHRLKNKIDSERQKAFPRGFTKLQDSQCSGKNIKGIVHNFFIFGQISFFE